MQLKAPLQSPATYNGADNRNLLSEISIRRELKKHMKIVNVLGSCVRQIFRFSMFRFSFWTLSYSGEHAILAKAARVSMNVI